ncbi:MULTISPECIES: DUF3465 domain-containing protein [unclassified Neisseria]|uniref:DUF3465 domain-containing protein n=1 Tax=unclassified Neisseria TaxID=2623750 RepID=UPI002665F5F4|nr:MULTISPECIES: DUF3465 domain-containing protein [unclassified Neisseria]MDO1510308.1 DUF3465 domain-containing protein [Neisseria sp. MVDL19-042950]MDO1516477.1 DUF3465 domain-containing protein [Neisseria sp. MVDL18-041461]MDO1563625.1 DUF3465 domain-containing protein [Neisseria sp. MVDL20-010259]
MKKIWIWLVLAAAVFIGYQQWQQHQTPPAQPSRPSVQAPAVGSGNAGEPAEKILQTAFERQQSDIQIQGSGIVSKTLPDDNKGSRHQRFILKLSSGQTLLVAHNIDLAPKIERLKKGDKVEFYGEYEWSERGGVIHWTHHDPKGRHPDGWLKHNGVMYQ